MSDSVSAQVARSVEQLPERAFLRTSEFGEPRGPVDSALSRLTRSDALVRIRPGLYWKGAPTPIGMSLPRTREIGIALGGPGSGPADVAAANMLGLTTQVPATVSIAVPRRTPAAYAGLRFTQRPVGRLVNSLTPWEVAVLEVLRAGPMVTESGMDDLARAAVRLACDGKARMEEIAAAAAAEPHRLARERWGDLCAGHPELAAAA